MVESILKEVGIFTKKGLQCLGILTHLVRGWWRGVQSPPKCIVFIQVPLPLSEGDWLPREYWHLRTSDRNFRVKIIKPLNSFGSRVHSCNFLIDGLGKNRHRRRWKHEWMWSPNDGCVLPLTVVSSTRALASTISHGNLNSKIWLPPDEVPYQIVFLLDMPAFSCRFLWIKVTSLQFWGTSIRFPAAPTGEESSGESSSEAILSDVVQWLSSWNF